MGSVEGRLIAASCKKYFFFSMLPLFLLYINICRYGMYGEFIYFYFLKRMSAAIFLIFLEGRDTAWRGRGTLINSIKPTGCACLISS